MGDTTVLVVELIALFIGVSFFVEILQRRMGQEQLQAWMGGRPVVAALKGIALGFLMPFCTYSAVPVLVGLHRAGVPPAGYVAFISAAPVLDPILFGALALIVGLKIAVAYVVVTFCAAMGLALTAQRVGVERHLKPELLARDQGCSTDRPEAWEGWRVESRHALRSSTRLFRSFGPLLAVGVTIGLLIESFVSPEVAAGVTTGAPWLSIPTATAIGTPLYFSTELFVPIAHSLDSAGVGVGPIVALTIAGAGANVPEFIVLSKMARPITVAIFVGFVFAVALTGGTIAHNLA